MKALLKALCAATVLGALVAGCGGGGGGSSTADTVAPTVLFTTPAHNASAIGTNSSLTITFSEAIDPATVTNTTIVLTDRTGGVPVNLTSLSYDATNRIVTLTPASLTGGHIYDAQVTTNVRDLAGNRVASPYSWSFTTAAGPDISPPIVTSTSPRDNDSTVGTNASIAMTFSEPMDAATVAAAFSLNPPTPGTLTYFGKTAVFRPTAPLAASTPYIATLAASATDLAGTAMGVAKIWTFTTGTGPDTTKPTVTATSPVDGATGISRTADITVTFDKAVHPNIFGKIDGYATDVTIDYTTNTVTMKPANPLRALTLYPFIIQVRDLSGNLMPSPFSWSFTTGN